MRFLLLLTFFFLTQACDPFKFGFKENPAYVLGKAYDAINSLDKDEFLKLTGKEALCIYGNQDGLKFLKKNLHIDEEKIDLVPEFIKSEYYRSPLLVGTPTYWSYYREWYEVAVNQKETNHPILQAIFECDYGKIGKKDESFLYLSPGKYQKKQCRIIKVIPKSFKSVKLPRNCQQLKVTL